jgi:hypothetical protein
MKCLNCSLKYIRQTGIIFHTRYKVHLQAIRNNNSNSGYSSHILNTGHTYGSITDTIDTISKQKEEKHFNALEKYHINISKNTWYMNGANIDTLNPVFIPLQEMNTS